MVTTEVSPSGTSRARILLLAVLGALAWLALSLFGTGSSASGSEDRDSLLGTLTETLETAVPAPELTQPVTSIVTHVVEPVVPVVDHVIPAPVERAVDTVASSAATIVHDTVEPVIELPVVDAAVTLVGGVVDEATDVLEPAVTGQEPVVPEAPATDSAELNAITATLPGALGPSWAAAVHITDATTATAISSTALPVQHAASPVAPAGPLTPFSPVDSDAVVSATTSAAAALIAAVPESSHGMAWSGAISPLENDAVPSSPTSDHDSSPD